MICHSDKCCTDRSHSESFPLIFILLVKSMHQKILQKFLSEKCLLKISICPRFDMFGPPTSRPIFSGPKFCLTYSFFLPKIFFASKFLLDPKFFWPKIIFDPKILFWPKHFLTNNYFEIIIFFEQKFADPKFIWIKYFSDQNFFWPTNFWTQNITQIFFGPYFFLQTFCFHLIFFIQP